MNTLKEGATGFWDINDKPIFRLVSFKQFKKAAYTLSLRVSGDVESLNDLDAGRSFYSAKVEGNRFDAWLVCNPFVPCFSLVSVDCDFPGDMRYLESDKVKESLAGVVDGEILGSTELDEPITIEMLSVLSDAERKQAKYWKPKRVGDLLFNLWD